MKNDKFNSENQAISEKKSKRIGIAKEEMKDFDISLDELDSIEIPDFDN